MSRLAFVSLTAVAALMQGCAQRPLTMPYSTAATNAAAPVVAPDTPGAARVISTLDKATAPKASTAAPPRSTPAPTAWTPSAT